MSRRALTYMDPMSPGHSSPDGRCAPRAANRHLPPQRARRMSDDLDNESEFGRVTWLSSEEDGGPDVGVVLGLGEGRSLFIGELPNITLQEHGLDPE